MKEPSPLINNTYAILADALCKMRVVQAWSFDNDKDYAQIVETIGDYLALVNHDFDKRKFKSMCGDYTEGKEKL